LVSISATGALRRTSPPRALMWLVRVRVRVGVKG
jgi:hypothetical protein